MPSGTGRGERRVRRRSMQMCGRKGPPPTATLHIIRLCLSFLPVSRPLPTPAHVCGTPRYEHTFASYSMGFSILSCAICINSHNSSWILNTQLHHQIPREALSLLQPQLPRSPPATRARCYARSSYGPALPTGPWARDHCPHSQLTLPWLRS